MWTPYWTEGEEDDPAVVGARPPAPEEARVVQARTKTRADIVDLAWALINTTEFLYRH